MVWKILGALVYLGIAIGSIVKVKNKFEELTILTEPKKIKIILTIIGLYVIASLVSSFLSAGFVGIIFYFLIFLNVIVLYGIGSWIIEENEGNGTAMILGYLVYLAVLGGALFLIIVPFIGLGFINVK